MECYACVIEALGLFDEALDRATAGGNRKWCSELQVQDLLLTIVAGATIQRRDEAYALAIASDDELFHFYLYDWHVARHLSEQLLEVHLPWYGE
jgi:nuclear pore complex protein Nup155